MVKSTFPTYSPSQSGVNPKRRKCPGLDPPPRLCPGESLPGRRGLRPGQQQTQKNTDYCKVCVKNPWKVVWFSHIINCLSDYHPEGMQCNATNGMCKKVLKFVVCLWSRSSVACSSVIVRFVLTKLANRSLWFDQMGQWELLIWSKQNGRWLLNAPLMMISELYSNPHSSNMTALKKFV